MQTIIVVFNPGKLENADMDLRYSVPDRFSQAIITVCKGVKQLFKNNF